MKKIVSYLSAFIMLLSLGWSGLAPIDVAAATTEETSSSIQVTFDIEDIIFLDTAEGVTLDKQDHSHGNHQTRVVHTSHGDYVASVSGFRESEYLTYAHHLTELSVVKVAPGATRAELIMQHTIPYQSSQITVVADNEENVWAGMVYENNWRDQFDAHKNGMTLDLFRVTPEGEVTQYYTIVSDIDINGGGIGYSTFYFDPSINSIICMSADAVAADPSYLYWKVFSLDTLTWAETTHSLQVHGGRNGYLFFNVDGKGGLVVVTNRNPYVRSNVTNYPEMENDDGIPEEMMKEYFPEGRQHVSYCFDQVNAYVIPDINQSDYRHFVVYDTDQSRIQGTDAERLTPEFRMKNEYPVIANNNGGDTYLDENGLLHVTTKVSYLKTAWNWEATESKWVHVVFDTATGEKISESLVWDELEVGQDCYARLYVDPVTDQIFIFSYSNNPDALVIMKAIGNPADGYVYEHVITKLTGERQWFMGNVNLAHHRSNSTVDGTLSLVSRGPEGYALSRIKLIYSGAEGKP